MLVEEEEGMGCDGSRSAEWGSVRWARTYSPMLWTVILFEVGVKWLDVVVVKVRGLWCGVDTMDL